MAFRAMTHYYLKEGKVKEGIEFIEKEIVAKAAEMGCHDLNLIQQQNMLNHVIGEGIWETLEEAKKFTPELEEKLEQLSSFCQTPPKREMYKICARM